jgi:hypothetical protein
LPPLPAELGDRDGRQGELVSLESFEGDPLASFIDRRYAHWNGYLWGMRQSTNHEASRVAKCSRRMARKADPFVGCAETAGRKVPHVIDQSVLPHQCPERSAAI